MRSPSVLRIFTAFSSSRSRLSVAWVTVSPSSASSFASWLWLRTGCRLRMSTIRRWRAVRVCGTAGPACGAWSRSWLIVVSFSGSSFPARRPAGLVQDAGECPEEGVHRVVREGERRHEPYDIGGGRVHEESGVLSRLLRLRRERLGEHDTQEEPGAPDMVDQRVAERLGSGAEAFALPLDVVQESVAFDGVEDGEGGRADDGVAAEGGAVAARCEQVGGPAEGDGGAQRQSAAEALGEGDDVGQDTVVGLVLEPGAGAADAGLHLVEDEQRAGGGGDGAGGLEVAGRRDDDAVLALDRLDDHHGGVLGDRGGQGLGVAVGDVGDV